MKLAVNSSSVGTASFHGLAVPLRPQIKCEYLLSKRPFCALKHKPQCRDLVIYFSSTVVDQRTSSSFYSNILFIKDVICMQSSLSFR